MAGHGWRMLVECLSVGRAISLPSNATGGVRMSARCHRCVRAHAQTVRPGRSAASKAWRKRWRASAGYTYAISGAVARDSGGRRSRRKTLGAFGDREIPRHRMGREGRQGRDGRARRQGRAARPEKLRRPRLAASPIAITVEGAEHHDAQPDDFRPGCDPLPSLRAQGDAGAVDSPITASGCRRFDRELFGHIGFAMSNAVRSFVLGITGARIGEARRATHTHAVTTASSIVIPRRLALVADMFMLLLGGKLKFKEKLSARLGDVLIESLHRQRMLKRYEDTGRPDSGSAHCWPGRFTIACGACRTRSMVRCATSRSVRSAWLLRCWCSRSVAAKCRRRIVSAIAWQRCSCAPNEARSRLAEWTYLTPNAEQHRWAA